jgi:hypothetical protein
VLIAAMHLPFHRWDVPATLRARLRPTLLALGMALLYATVLAVPTLRDFFELVLLRPVEYAAIVGGIVLWRSVSGGSGEHE